MAFIKITLLWPCLIPARVKCVPPIRATPPIEVCIQQIDDEKENNFKCSVNDWIIAGEGGSRTPPDVGVPADSPQGEEEDEG